MRGCAGARSNRLAGIYTASYTYTASIHRFLTGPTKGSRSELVYRLVWEAWVSVTMIHSPQTRTTPHYPISCSMQRADTVIHDIKSTWTANGQTCCFLELSLTHPIEYIDKIKSELVVANELWAIGHMMSINHWSQVAKHMSSFPVTHANTQCWYSNGMGQHWTLHSAPKGNAMHCTTQWYAQHKASTYIREILRDSHTHACTIPHDQAIQ